MAKKIDDAFAPAARTWAVVGSEFGEASFGQEALARFRRAGRLPRRRRGPVLTRSRAWVGRRLGQAAAASCARSFSRAIS